MPKKRLIDATDLVRRVLEERGKIRLEVVPRYGFGVPVPSLFGQAMVGGIRKALREIETSQTVDAVEVVRCRDCKHTTRSKVSPEKIICCLTKMCGTVDPDYFCADGEREIDAEVKK